jgi:hypothetical protein
MPANAKMLSSDAALPPCDARLGTLHRYWQSIRPTPTLLPGRQHFDPLAVPTLLSWLWLLDVHRRPLRFKYRLVGTRHVDSQGSDPTHLWIDEAHADFVGSPAHKQLVAVAEHGEVAFYRGPPTYAVTKEYLVVERLVLPLARNGKDVDILLGITLLDPRAPRG